MNLIRIFPDPILLKVASPIREITDEIKKLADDMIFIMKSKDAVGLAAPQIGESVRLVAISGLADRSDKDIVAINPEITWASTARTVREEFCLSRPGFSVEVRRHKEIAVRATGLNGVEFEIEARGWAARVWQHEIDHLNGIVIGGTS